MYGWGDRKIAQSASQSNQPISDKRFGHSNKNLPNQRCQPAKPVAAEGHVVTLRAVGFSELVHHQFFFFLVFQIHCTVIYLFALIIIFWGSYLFGPSAITCLCVQPDIKGKGRNIRVVFACQSCWLLLKGRRVPCLIKAVRGQWPAEAPPPLISH